MLDENYTSIKVCQFIHFIKRVFLGNFISPEDNMFSNIKEVCHLVVLQYEIVVLIIMVVLQYKMVILIVMAECLYT